MVKSHASKIADTASVSQPLNPYLVALGQRVRSARECSAISRKALAEATGVSERHLANLEYGSGNVSVLVLQQVAGALHCSIAELIGDFSTASPEWQMIRSLLENRDEQTLHRARLAIAEVVASSEPPRSTNSRIALIGLRGAGKSSLGQRLATDLGCPFIELSREIENFASCSIGEIHDMYGASAYRRYERQALQQVIHALPAAVIATPGGLASDAANFDLLLSSCQSIWLQASPADHMQRVIEQGDFRPMAGNGEAMEDLKGILAARKPFYSRAQFRLDTSQQPFETTFKRLRSLAQTALDSDSTPANAV